LTRPPDTQEAPALLPCIARHARRALPGTPQDGGELAAARAWLVNGLARALVAGRRPELARFLRPLVPGAIMPGGARVPGTSLELDPVQGAFVNALLSGWESGPTGNPCQHLGSLLAVADYLARKALMEGHAPLTVRELLGALLTSHQIQTGLARLLPPLQGAGDPALLLRVAQTAVVTALLGGSATHIINAVSQAFLDGIALPLPATGPDAWRNADASGRAVRLALLTLAGEMGYPGALDAPRWGFCDVVLATQPALAPPSFDGRLPEQPGGAEEALQQLAAAAAQTFRPPHVQKINTLLAGPLEQLDARPVSELMANLVTHAVREASRQMALLP
jgi:2-methylcitrate dehydratase PrpD